MSKLVPLENFNEDTRSDDEIFELLGIDKPQELNLTSEKTNGKADEIDVDEESLTFETVDFNYIYCVIEMTSASEKRKALTKLVENNLNEVGVIQFISVEQLSPSLF